MSSAVPPLAVIIRASGVPVTPNQLKLEHGRCTVGAGSGADIIVEDRAVSRQHVELTLCPEGVLVRDLSSRNGTYHLGKRIEQAVVAPGDNVRIGACELAIDVDLDVLASVQPQHGSYRGLIGTTEPMRHLFATLARLEGSLVSVLIEGEAGVGKELVARALHQGSALSHGPFMAVSCDPGSRELVLSQLFGHAQGAISGAAETRVGAFEAANGGTLFLDDVAALPIDVQPALLRALESGETRRTGESEPRKVSVRVIAATQRDLRPEVAAGRFREDLYRRLAAVKLVVPSLAERPGDIPVLAAEIAREAGAGELPMEVMVDLAQRSWPGNVRELRHAVLAYLAVGRVPEADLPAGGLLEVALRQSVDPEQPYQEQKELFNTLFSRVYFEALLARTDGSEAEAARISNVERAHLAKLLVKYRVRR